jgi:hypothetical protein
MADEAEMRRAIVQLYDALVDLRAHPNDREALDKARQVVRSYESLCFQLLGEMSEDDHELLAQMNAAHAARPLRRLCLLHGEREDRGTCQAPMGGGKVCGMPLSEPADG